MLRGLGRGDIQALRLVACLQPSQGLRSRLVDSCALRASDPSWEDGLEGSLEDGLEGGRLVAHRRAALEDVVGEAEGADGLLAALELRRP